MKTFKEYLEEQRQIEEGLGSVIGGALDTAAVATGRAIAATGRAAKRAAGIGLRAAGRGLKSAGKAAVKHGPKIGHAGVELVKTPFKILGAALPGGHHDGRTYDKGKKEGREQEAQKHRDIEAAKQAEEAIKQENEAHRATLHAHAKALGFKPESSVSMGGYHSFMEKIISGHPSATIHSSGMAWDTSGKAWSGAAGARAAHIRVQTSEEHNAAKAALEKLKERGAL